MQKHSYSTYRHMRSQVWRGSFEKDSSVTRGRHVGSHDKVIHSFTFENEELAEIWFKELSSELSSALRSLLRSLLSNGQLPASAIIQWQAGVHLLTSFFFFPQGSIQWAGREDSGDDCLRFWPFLETRRHWSCENTHEQRGLQPVFTGVERPAEGREGGGLSVTGVRVTWYQAGLPWANFYLLLYLSAVTEWAVGRCLFVPEVRAHCREADCGGSGGQKPEEDGCGRTIGWVAEENSRFRWG